MIQSEVCKTVEEVFGGGGEGLCQKIWTASFVPGAGSRPLRRTCPVLSS